MFHKIMVPVDLGHIESLKHSLEVAAQMARTFDCTVCYVGVTAVTPTAQGHNPKEFAQKLAAFAEAEGDSRGLRVDSAAFPSHDPSIDLNDVLLDAADKVGADLIIMQSHVPNLADHLWPAHGGRVATRAKASVLVVR